MQYKPQTLRHLHYSPVESETAWGVIASCTFVRSGLDWQCEEMNKKEDGENTQYIFIFFGDFIHDL